MSGGMWIAVGSACLALAVALWFLRHTVMDVLCGLRPWRWRYATGVGEIVGYGLANQWHRCNPWALVRSLRTAGCTATTREVLSWAADGFYDAPGGMEDEDREFQRAMKHGKIMDFACVANDNKGKKPQYGDGDGRTLADFLKQLAFALEIVLEHRHAGTVVIPVGETKTAAGTAFETAAIARCRAVGCRTGWNHGSQPESAGPFGCDYFVQHPASTKSIGSIGAVLVTDSGALRETQEGPPVNGIPGTPRPDVIGAWAERARRSRGRGFIYYDFNGRKPHAKTITAIGKAWRSV